jgi:Tfp pilus assembly protein PilF
MNEKALQLNDKNYMVWRNLAENYAWTGQVDKWTAAHRKELELLQRDSELRPQDAELIGEMASLYAEFKERDKATMFIKKALALAPEDANVLIAAASVAESQGNRAEAVRYAKEGVSKGFTMDDLRRNFALRELANDPAFQAPVKK